MDLYELTGGCAVMRGGEPVHELSHELFVGRTREVVLLRHLVDSVAAGAATCVVSGEVGIGKTALLRQVADQCPARVLWVRGSAAESRLPFAAAADLLTPLREHVAALPPPQRQALNVALAISEGPAPADLSVFTGALGLLTEAAAAEPLVVLVDDLQWVDPKSRRLLLFVARRLTGQRLLFLVATRNEPAVEASLHGFNTVRLTGLTEAECEPIARVHRPDLCSAELSELVRAIGGNPQALLDAMANREAQSSAQDWVRVGIEVRRAWEQVLSPLPRRARDALFAVAAAQAPCLPVQAVLVALGLDLDDLEPAEHLGVVITQQDRPTLASPILRYVLADTTPLGVRLNTYRVLADLAGPDQRVWLLAKAAIGPDEEIADELALAAENARERSGHGAAGELMHRAADLTSSEPRRAERLLSAAADSLLAGRTIEAERWSREAGALRADPSFRASVTTLRARALMWMGRAQEAVDELLNCADALESSLPQSVPGLMREALMPMAMTGELRECVALARHSERLAPLREASFHEQTMVAAAYLLAGDFAAGCDRLALAEESAVAADPVRDQQALVTLAQARWWMGDFDLSLSLVSATIEAVRRHGTAAVLPLALAVRSEVSIRTGRWESAYADAQEAVRWATEQHQPGIVGYAIGAVARIEAARGRRATCVERVERSRREAGTSVGGSLSAYESAALGLAALAIGEPAEAVEHLLPAWRRARAQGLGHPDVVPSAADLVEALVHCGRLAEAGEVLAWLEVTERSSGLPHLAALADRARGLVTQDDAASLAAFDRAVAVYDRHPMPFERARTLLCAGERLRRARRRVDARMPLREAERIFAGLGARPWADRAAVELAASGVRAAAAPLDSAAVGRLSAQELQIALAVADGKSNVEVAAALFVSRKTVEAHLTRIYRRLGLASRTELTRELTHLLDHGGSPLPIVGARGSSLRSVASSEATDR